MNVMERWDRTNAYLKSVLPLSVDKGQVWVYFFKDSNRGNQYLVLTVLVIVILSYESTSLGGIHKWRQTNLDKFLPPSPLCHTLMQYALGFMP